MTVSSLGVLFALSLAGPPQPLPPIDAELREMRALIEAAIAASRAAETAATVEGVREGAEAVYRATWGLPSGAAGRGALLVPSWKEEWQTSGAEFDTAFVKRYGAEPPMISDPDALGVMGRGRAIQRRLEAITDTISAAPAAEKTAAADVLASLNNVIGWMHLTTGFKGTEVQPRISLTHVWDYPAGFWQSTADTGWLAEAYSQSSNILKTDYAGDLEEARRHAADMTRLLVRVLEGVDADGDGRVENLPMEGALEAALARADDVDFSELPVTLNAPATR